MSLSNISATMAKVFVLLRTSCLETEMMRVIRKTIKKTIKMMMTMMMTMMMKQEKKVEAKEVAKAEMVMGVELLLPLRLSTLDCL